MDFPYLAETAFLQGNILFIPVVAHRNPFNFPLHTSSGKRLGFTTLLAKNRLDNLLWMSQQLGMDLSQRNPRELQKTTIAQLLEGRVCFLRI